MNHTLAGVEDSNLGSLVRCNVPYTPSAITSLELGERDRLAGMTDELAHALAQLPGLRIAGRTSSYAFKGKAVTAQEIGRALDVAAIVGGTVRRAGDRLRVTTQLVSTRDGKVMWDSAYESHSQDALAVQDEFTRAIAATLARSLGDRSAVAQDPRFYVWGDNSRGADDLAAGRSSFCHESLGRALLLMTADRIRRRATPDHNGKPSRYARPTPLLPRATAVQAQ